jgi:hypothetical protein
VLRRSLGCDSFAGRCGYEIWFAEEPSIISVVRVRYKQGGRGSRAIEGLT